MAIKHPATLIVNGRIVLQGASFMACANQLAAMYPDATLAPQRYSESDKNSPLLTGIDRKRLSFYQGASITFKMRIPGQVAMAFAMIVRYVSPKQLSAWLTHEELDGLSMAITAGAPAALKSHLFCYTKFTAALYKGNIGGACVIALTFDEDSKFVQGLTKAMFAYHSDYSCAPWMLVAPIPFLAA